MFDGISGLLMIFCTICLVYFVFRIRYVKDRYILKGLDSNQRTVILGDYIDVFFNDFEMRICKGDDSKWYIQKLNTEEIEQTELKYGKIFQIGDEEFMIIKEERQGGFWTLMNLIFIMITIMSLYLQGNKIIRENAENQGNELWNTRNELMGFGQIGDSLACTWDMINVIDNEIINSEKKENKEDYLANIHSFVLANEEVFQNDISIEWELYQSDGNMRRSLQNVPSEMGISVSKYQEIIDWEKVEQDGIDFAIIQVGSRGYEDGTLYRDSYFKDNIEGATKNGVKVGVSFHSNAINQNEMDQEIELIVDALQEYNLDYPVGITLKREENLRTSELSDEEYIDLIKYFCIRIKQNGYQPMIMGDIEWFQQFPQGTFNGYFKLVYSPNIAPSDINNCIIWQYRENTRGVVAGVRDDLVLSVNLSAYVHNEDE